MADTTKKASGKRGGSGMKPPELSGKGKRSGPGRRAGAQPGPKASPKAGKAAASGKGALNADFLPGGGPSGGASGSAARPAVRRVRQYDMPSLRVLLGLVMAVLALCAIFGAFGSSAILLNWLAALLKGLFGYGYWLSMLVFPFCAAVLLRHPDKPARDRILPALALMPTLGVLGHILFCSTTFPENGVWSRLWSTGQGTHSGGVFSGTTAQVLTKLLSAQVTFILFFVLFLWLLTAALRWNVPAMIDLIRRRIVYGEDWEDWDGEEDESWIHPRVEVIRSDEDTQRVFVRQQFDFPLDGEDMAAGDDGALWQPDRADGGGAARDSWDPWQEDSTERGGDGTAEPRPARPGRETHRAARRNPPKRGLFSAFQGAFRSAVADEAGRLFRDRRGVQTARGGGFDEYDGYDRPSRSRDAVLGSNAGSSAGDLDDVRETDRGRGSGRRSSPTDRGARASGADSAPRASGADSGQGAAEPRQGGKPSGRRAQPGAGGANGPRSGGGTAEAAAVPDAELDPRKARAAASREVAAQQAAVSQEIAQNMVKPERKYRYPALSNLYENKSRNYVEAGAELRGNSRRLADTLNSFGVEATPGDVIHGPAVTRYEYTLEQGVKLSKITNLADDIALALGATGVRIAPIPTKSSVVGIEVPNRQVTPVLIRDVVASQDFRNHPSTTAFALGKDIGGKNIVGCIEQLPHVLIAGTTGSGKSVCTNSLIISMLFHARPDQVRFIMVDPKMVELAPYNGIPHLLIPVVTDPKKAAGALQWATVEMMKRYRTFSEYGVKKLSEYNKAADARGLEAMPSIVVVIDELADLMMAAAKEVEESIVRIAQMGRAAGMHLVIATQRPSADVITGLMKANIPSRIAFAVASSMESRIILDTPGAEKLVGKGDMLYAPLGESRIRVQGCYIAPEEIERVVAFVKQTSEASYDNDVIAKIEAVVQEKKPPEQMSIPETPQEDDELLPAAVEVVLETGQASVSMLQRRLKLGYSRAARLVDQMEEKGYVGPFEGSKPRQLILTQEKWQEMKLSQAAAR